MKPLILLTGIILTFISCDRKIDNPNSFKTFDFSYNDVFSTCFSIKFTHSDTAYIKQHFASAFYDTPKSNATYFAILSIKDRYTLDSFINNLDFTKLYASYHENYQDGVDYEFYIEKDTIKKIIYRHSSGIRDNLDTFGLWIVEMKTKLKLSEIDTTITFESTKFFLPPKVSLSPINFEPPKLKNRH